MSEPGKLIVKAKLDHFFREEVDGALQALNYRLGEGTEIYLVNLLCAFSRQQSVCVRLQREPLALMYQRAHQSQGAAERVKTLRELGDTALVTSGFFADAIERSLVDIDYYIGMGGGAYRSLGHLLAQRPERRNLAELYRQMGQNFTRLVDVLNQISDRSQAQGSNDHDLLKLYDRWARTGSERIGRMLSQRGLPVVPNLPTEFEQ